jgi:hypothetical protein
MELAQDNRQAAVAAAAAARGVSLTAPPLHPPYINAPTAQQSLTRAANLVRATPCSPSPI